MLKSNISSAVLIISCKLLPVVILLAHDLRIVEDKWTQLYELTIICPGSFIKFTNQLQLDAGVIRNLNAFLIIKH